MDAMDSFLTTEKGNLLIPPRQKINVRFAMRNIEQAERTSTLDNIERETYSLISSILPLLKRTYDSIENISKENVLSTLREINNGNQNLFAKRLEKVADNIFADICTLNKNQKRRRIQTVSSLSPEQLASYKSRVKGSTISLISLYDKLENSNLKAKEKVRHNKKSTKKLLKQKTHSLLKQFLPLIYSIHGDMSKIDRSQIYKHLKDIVSTDSDIPLEKLLYLSKLVEEAINKLGGNFMHEIVRRSQSVSLHTPTERKNYISAINPLIEEVVTHLDRLDDISQ